MRMFHLLHDPPPVMAFEISATGLAVARLGQQTELGFFAFKPGTIAISPLKDNVIDSTELTKVVRAAAGTSPRKRRDVAVILPDYATRTAVLDFDNFPSDAKEQQSLIRFRMKRSVPFDVDSAAISYHPQPNGKRVDVVVVLAPLEVVSRYEAPFRAAGLAPGFVTVSAMAALELVPDAGLSVVAKLSGHVLTVLVRDQSTLKLVRCIELSSASLEDIADYLFPTFVYVEDNLGAAAQKLLLCGFGAGSDETARRFEDELKLPVESVRSPLGVPGEHNAGLFGYLRSLERN